VYWRFIIGIRILVTLALNRARFFRGFIILESNLALNPIFILIISTHFLLFCPSSQIMKSLTQYFRMVRVLKVEKVYVLERGLSANLWCSQSWGQLFQILRVNHEVASVKGILFDKTRIFIHSIVIIECYIPMIRVSFNINILYFHKFLS
jgi:hypothetical protein